MTHCVYWIFFMAIIRVFNFNAYYIKYPVVWAARIFLVRIA